MFRTTLIILLLSAQILFGQQTGKDGKTFQARKASYLMNLEDATSSVSESQRIRNLYGWLENGIWNDVVKSAIDSLLYGKAPNEKPHWFSAIRGHNVNLIMVLRKWGPTDGDSTINSTYEDKITNKFDDFISKSRCFQGVNDQKQMYQMASVYMYTLFYGNRNVPNYGVPDGESPTSTKEDAWPDFSYNGHSYFFNNGPYDANTLARDFLEWALDGWYVQKINPATQREFDSPDYSRAFAGAFSALVSLLPSSDPLYTKAKMAVDFMLLDYMLDESQNAGHCGTFGRADYKWTSRNSVYPTYQYFGIGGLEAEERSDINAVWFHDYEPPDLLVDLINMNDQSVSDWLWHTEYNPGFLHDDDFGKWVYQTKNYCIGSNKGNSKQGWSVVINTEGSNKNFIRFWINKDSTAPPDNREGNYLGDKGNQFQNAIFADLGGSGNLWVRFHGGVSWDDETTTGGWDFKKDGDVMVAIKIASSTACVEMATVGVEYADYSAFQSAVTGAGGSSCGNDSFKTSRGDVINDDDFAGRLSPGDASFPFDRMGTWDGNGNQIIDWNNNVMTVTLEGNSLTYNFNNWTSSSTTGGNQPPVSINNGPYSGEINQSISFSSSGSNDPDGNIVSYLWDFGDGTTSILPNPSNTYTSSGNFSVSLKVTDNDSASNTSFTSATITDPNAQVTADAGGPYSGQVGTDIVFDGSGSQGSNLTYSWDFGDTVSGTGVSPSHPYNSEGTYTVILTVDDGSGNTDSDTTTATIQAVSAGTFESTISNPTDDAEQRSNDTVTTNSPDLELVDDGSDNQIVGLRFSNVTIPQGATISNAYVQFTADRASTIPTSLTINGEAADDPVTFSDTNSDISSRDTTFESAAWNPPAWNTIGAAGEDQRTSDLKEVIEEIVNRSGWTSGNALVLIISGSGSRAAESKEGNPTAPTIHIEYNSNVTTDAGGPYSGQVGTAIVFDGSGSQGPNLTYSWDFGDTVSGTGVSPSHPYNSAGTYTVILTVDDGSGNTDSDTTTATIQSVSTFESTISFQSDDAEQRSNNTVTKTSPDLELVDDNNDNQIVGLRFRNVTIPQGATITNAYVQFTADENSTIPTFLTINGEAADDPVTFSETNSNISSRDTTFESAAWNPPAWNTIGAAGEDQRTSDLKEVIEEIVNRSGWTSGNALVLIITGSGKRVAESKEGNPTAPTIHIEYLDPLAKQVYLTDSFNSLENNKPESYTLKQNYPNPFNPTTTIQFELPKTSSITISVYNMKGEKLEELYRGEKEAGIHTLVWKASDYASGMYLIELKGENFINIKKSILLK